MPMLEVKDLQAGYDEVPVLHGVSLSVEEGEIVALVGANGAGKSTTMRAIAGLLVPKGGTISFLGRKIEGLPAAQVVKSGLAYVPEGRRLFGKLSVKENLMLGAYLETDPGKIRERLERVLALFPRLAERLTQHAETMSGGEQQMLAIARGLMSAPRMLLIDEMSLGLMPALVEKVMEAVVEIRRAGLTVVLVEQMVQEALEIADRGYVIQSGRIALSGKAHDLLDNPEVRAAYLGM